MGTAQKLLGSWGADLDAWSRSDPAVASFGPMLLAGLDVSFTPGRIRISGRGKEPPKEYDYTVASETDGSVTLAASKGGRTGTYVVEFSDDDHVAMRLTEPKKDLMVLKRKS